MIWNKGQSIRDCSVHVLKRNKEVILYLLLYVDDIFMKRSIEKDIDKLKKTLNVEFNMKDLGEVKRIIEMNIKRNCKRSDKTVNIHLEWKMIKPSTFIWIITQSFRLCNVLKPNKKKDDEEYSLCKWDWKHHVWYGLCPNLTYVVKIIISLWPILVKFIRNTWSGCWDI